jgi:alkylation response protein AidB-like acyl-CoA dehydrogenase
MIEVPTSDESSFRIAFKKWLNANAPIEPEPHDENERFLFRRNWLATLSQGGFSGITWPTEYGGRGEPPTSQIAFYEELARVNAPFIINYPGLLLLGPTLMVHGTEQQKMTLLPRILSGEDIWCQCFSEPDAGSDLNSLRTRAFIDGDEVVITGQKIWTTWGHFADKSIVLCRIGEGFGRDTITMVMVDLRQPGVLVRPIRQITGESEFAEVFFDGARAPISNIIGGVGEGWKVATTLLEFERSDLGFTDHAKLFWRLGQVAQRIQSRRESETGLKIESLRERFITVWSYCQILKRGNMAMLRSIESGEKIGFKGSLLKTYYSRVIQAVALLEADSSGLDVCLDSPDGFNLLASRAATIYAGTSEIQKNILSERLLGLPREKV